MKIQIENVKTLDQIKEYWTIADYSKLLAAFDFPDAQGVKDENLKEMLFMAISDFETNEAAEILLTYKLSDRLNEGQIDSLSHEMTVDKVAEEYPEPSLHYDLFNINQLLFKAYNGKFPNTEATEVTFKVLEDDGIEIGENKELLAKVFAGGLKESCLIKRLYSDQLEGDAEFIDAHKFIWKIEHPEKDKYKILTSKYWVDKNEIAEEYAVDIKMFEKE